ncbi:tRNA1(Val) (adenine(37)-N6)-methyltransferase [Roseibium limicola]|uniref:Methyltransferase n=1 Tax=Roseibium limicola TaxID=2816037 RepID=A0A939J4M3_9HYPH|nr:methyltransferase [Roseibium limicola]MBO0344900.1 methyltransferase [Roseibium limicola]
MVSSGEDPLRARGNEPATDSLDGPTTYDAFLGGQVHLRQPAKGRHRAGMDAVYLAAALPDQTSGHVVDLGSGVGTAGLCAAARLQTIHVTLVDVDPLALDLAQQNLNDPANAAFAQRTKVMTADITAKGTLRHASGLTPGLADHVIMNPPYYESDRFRASPQLARAGAHMLDARGLDPWTRTASDILGKGGSLTVIFRADGLQELLNAMVGRFGAIDIIPLRPRAEAPATRVLVRAVRGSKAPLQLLPGFVIHQDNGSDFTTQARSVMRDGQGLGLSPRR